MSVGCDLCALEEQSDQTFETRPVGIVALKPWPPHIHVSTELIEQADRRVLTVGEGSLEFRCVNGWAIYRVTRQGARWWDGEKWASEWEPSA